MAWFPCNRHGKRPGVNERALAPPSGFDPAGFQFFARQHRVAELFDRNRRFRRVDPAATIRPRNFRQALQDLLAKRIPGGGQESARAFSYAGLQVRSHVGDSGCAGFPGPKVNPMVWPLAASRRQPEGASHHLVEQLLARALEVAACDAVEILLHQRTKRRKIISAANEVESGESFRPGPNAVAIREPRCLALCSVMGDQVDFFGYDEQIDVADIDVLEVRKGVDVDQETQSLQRLHILRPDLDRYRFDMKPPFGLQGFEALRNGRMKRLLKMNEHFRLRIGPQRIEDEERNVLLVGFVHDHGKAKTLHAHSLAPQQGPRQVRMLRGTFT